MPIVETVYTKPVDDFTTSSRRSSDEVGAARNTRSSPVRSLAAIDHTTGLGHPLQGIGGNDDGCSVTSHADDIRERHGTATDDDGGGRAHGSDSTPDRPVARCLREILCL